MYNEAEMGYCHKHNVVKKFNGDSEKKRLLIDGG